MTFRCGVVMFHFVLVLVDQIGSWGLGRGAFQLPRVIEGGVGVNDSREFEFYPGVALAARGGWALHQGQVV